MTLLRYTRRLAAITLLAACALPAQAAIPASERQVLLDLYASTNGAGWVDNAGWGGPASSECGWVGITCDAAGEHVTELDLYANNLVGTLPPGLSQLTALELVNLSDNQLSGTIPSLAGLTALQRFSVSQNQLTGELPWLSGLTALRRFDAYNNQLSGPMPLLVGLVALEEFTVNDNQLTGYLPHLTGLTALQHFRFDHNQITGPLPDLAGLPALTILRADNNQLTGTPPAAPASLLASQSTLCPNFLHAPSPTDAAWDTATAGAFAWQTHCTPGYTIDTAADPGGRISPPQGVAAGATATITITPDAGYVVDSVSGTCGLTFDAATSTYTTAPATADCTVAASFARVAAATVAPVPTLGQWVLALLATLAAGLGAMRLRRR